MSDRQLTMGIIEKVFIKFKDNLLKGYDNFNENDGYMLLGAFEKIVRPILNKDEITIQDVQYALYRQYDSALVSAFALILSRMMDWPLSAMGAENL